MRIFEEISSLSPLSEEAIEEFFVLVDTLPPAEIAGVLAYLLGRFDAGDAVAFVTDVRRLHGQREIAHRFSGPTVNLVGTGGGRSTFNITTTAAFVLAAAGAIVVKTGSNAFRSAAGFADVASRLGTLKVTMPWDLIELIAEDVGIVFVPPSYHAPILGRLSYLLTPPTYRNVGAYLNKLGPLLSPVHVDYRFIGAHSRACLEMLAHACEKLGDVPTTLVSSLDGLDEVSTSAQSILVDLRGGIRVDSIIDPALLGIVPPPEGALRGHEATAAAECCELILRGNGTQAQNEIVAINAAAVLSRVGIAADLPTGFALALQIINNGAGYEKLRQLRERVWKCAKY